VSAARKAMGEGSEFSAAQLAPLQRLRARFQGGLHGLAACDALAVATQFRRPGSFEPVGDLLGGGPFDLPRGGWSDDTAMALCLAESLLACGGSDVADQRARYLRWQRAGYLSATDQCLGITAASAQALAAEPMATRSAAPRAPGLMNLAEGVGAAPGEPLSRLLPVALYALGQPARLEEWAVASAGVTTDSPITLDAARILAHMLQAALLGASPARVLRHEPERYEADALCAPVARLAASSAVERPGPQGSQALEVLALARWCFASTRSFRAGALQAANLGGDADMVCAVYGQLAGLHYGVDAIPRGWRTALMHADQLTELADRLLREALLPLAEPGGADVVTASDPTAATAASAGRARAKAPAHARAARRGRTRP
jgi:ADP-ribosyl-[dinitrogen reductase] hydrolase